MGNIALALLWIGCATEPVIEGADVDGDGFVASDDGGTDCDDNDAAISPDAVEVCNGVDDDCDGLVVQ